MRKYSIGISIAGVLLLLMAPMLGTYLAGFYLRLTDGMETEKFLRIIDGGIRSFQIIGTLITGYGLFGHRNREA